MIVIVGGRGGRDGDLRSRDARGEQAARPAHRLNGLVIGRRRAGGADYRRMRRCARDRDAGAVQPCGNAPGAGRPSHGYMGGERLEQRPPTGREFGKADNLQRAEDPRGMTDTGGCGGDDVERPHHAGRKLVEDGRFQARDSGETRMIGRACGKIDARAPGFVERVGCRVDHAGKSLDALQLPHRRGRQGRLDGRAQALIVDRTSKSAGKSDGRLLERHDLEAVTTATTRREAALPHGEATVNNQGGSARYGHNPSPNR